MSFKYLVRTVSTIVGAASLLVPSRVYAQDARRAPPEPEEASSAPPPAPSAAGPQPPAEEPRGGPHRAGEADRGNRAGRAGRR